MRFRLAFLLLIGVAALAIPAHFWISDRLAVKRFFYPVQAVLSDSSIRCSIGSPEWMHGAVSEAVWRNYSLSNQLVHIDADGHLDHCVSGWQKEMLLSPLLAATDRFRYASVTKLFTADAVLQQVESGHLSLDSRLVDLLPELMPVADRRLEQVTIKHLLTHQAGFDRLRSPDPMALHNVKPWCPYDLKPLSKLHLDFSPGERHAYSNLGYCLLGVVLERLTGVDYRDWIYRQYDLKSVGIRFVDVDYFEDEVRYDFRNSLFYGESYARYFDLKALSSSAGLSGSAGALALVVHNMLKQKSALNLLSAEITSGCDQTMLRQCYGYALYRLRREDSDFHLDVQPGFLFGVSSVVVVDSRGGVTVWLGNGMPISGIAGDEMTEYLFATLARYYSS